MRIHKGGFQRAIPRRFHVQWTAENVGSFEKESRAESQSEEVFSALYLFRTANVG